MIPKFSVLIVGAGQIGAFFDTPESPNILTHAHAFTKHPNFELLGFMDIVPDNAAKAAAIWGGKPFGSLAEAFAQRIPDVVCVATPDPTHYSFLLEIAQYPVRLIFMEKPFAQNIKEIEHLQHILEQATFSVAVNYSRRFVPEFIQVREAIHRGECGEFMGGAASYGKGLYHNGSHMLNLLEYWLDQFTTAQVLDTIQDCYAHDPSVSAILQWEK